MTATGTHDRERLGIGLAAVGRPAYITAGRVADLGADRDVVTLRDRTLAVLDAAYAAGIRYVDAARSCGRAVLDDAAVHRALAGLRAQGVRVGISTSGPGQADAVRRALAVTVDGTPLFTSFQSTWTALEPSAGPALAEAAAAGARVIVKEAVANGRLAPGGADSPGARPRESAGSSARVGTFVRPRCTCRLRRVPRHSCSTCALALTKAPTRGSTRAVFIGR